MEFVLGMGDVAEMQNQISVGNFLEGAFEGLHHFYWEVGDEANRIEEGDSGS